MSWEIILGAVGTLTVAVLGALGTLYVRAMNARTRLRQTEADIALRQAEAEATRETAKAAAERLLLKGDRLDEIEQYARLIKRQDATIERHTVEMRELREELTKNVRDCEEREEVGNQKIARLERQYGRAIERLRMSEDQCRRYIKGYTMPPFREETDDGSHQTPVMV